ncbi:hypothetical protein PR048_023921 [Dryococelus australis]|uniref:NYN domain-containing protein n=1 Tax=Dryococelus australis TaxID=614101 RepID=A0ABQ9GVD9_9NEOP|nr:hypothetical protein PR048_023921 [Dryococelus australis]
MKRKKTKLIEMLVETLTARGIEASIAAGDADGSIVRCSLNKVTSHSSVVVIGEDVDLLVLLTALTPPDRNVYFMKPGRGNITTRYTPPDNYRSYPLVDLYCSSTVSQDATQHVRYSTKVNSPS